MIGKRSSKSFNSIKIYKFATISDTDDDCKSHSILIGAGRGEPRGAGVDNRIMKAMRGASTAAAIAASVGNNNNGWRSTLIGE